MNTAINTLKPFAAKMFKALNQLAADYEPHPCGGFTTDDMEWRSGIAFVPDSDWREAIEEMTSAGLIRYAGFDDEDAIGHCYEPITPPQ